MTLIATVEDVLRVNAEAVTYWDAAKSLGCNRDILMDAVNSLHKRGLVDHTGCTLTPRGHDYIARAQLGWPVEEVS
jgi:hypothetical protein